MFVPSNYNSELHQGLQWLIQRYKTFYEYYKEMEMAMIRIRANKEEDREAIMARLLSGLTQEIVDVLKLHYYVELEDMIHMEIKVEREKKKTLTTTKDKFFYTLATKTDVKTSQNQRGGDKKGKR